MNTQSTSSGPRAGPGWMTRPTGQAAKSALSSQSGLERRTLGRKPNLKACSWPHCIQHPHLTLFPCNCKGCPHHSDNTAEPLTQFGNVSFTEEQNPSFKRLLLAGGKQLTPFLKWPTFTFLSVNSVFNRMQMIIRATEAISPAATNSQEVQVMTEIHEFKDHLPAGWKEETLTPLRWEHSSEQFWPTNC